MNLHDLRRRPVTAGTPGLALVAASAVVTVPTAAPGVPATPGSCTAGALPVPDTVATSLVTAADPTGAVSCSTLPSETAVLLARAEGPLGRG